MYKLLRVQEAVGNVKKENSVAYLSQNPGLLPHTRATLLCNWRGYRACYMCVMVKGVMRLPHKENYLVVKISPLPKGLLPE